MTFIFALARPEMGVVAADVSSSRRTYALHVRPLVDGWVTSTGTASAAASCGLAIYQALDAGPVRADVLGELIVAHTDGVAGFLGFLGVSTDGAAVRMRSWDASGARHDPRLFGRATQPWFSSVPPELAPVEREADALCDLCRRDLEQTADAHAWVERVTTLVAELYGLAARSWPPESEVGPFISICGRAEIGLVFRDGRRFYRGPRDDQAREFRPC